MGVIAAAIYALIGFALGLFVLSFLGLPSGVVLTGASLIAAFGFLLESS
jgi:hypothetical protein